MIKNEDGQTSIEYILMILVVVIMSIEVFKVLNGYIIENPNSLMNRYLLSYKSAFGGEDGGATLRYKTFKLYR